MTGTPLGQPMRRDVVTPLPAGAPPSTWLPLIVPVSLGPPAKRRRRDMMTSQFAECDFVSGDSYHTANSAVFYTAPDARSVALADAPINPFQSQLEASPPGQMGAGNSQIAFSRGETQRAFRHALLFDRYRPNEHLASLAELLDGLLESRGATLTDLISEQHGLTLWLDVDVHYRHMVEERIAVRNIITQKPTPPSCLTTSRSIRCSTDLERRCSSAMRTSCGMPAHLYWTTSSRLSCMSLDIRQPKEAHSASCLNSSP